MLRSFVNCTESTPVGFWPHSCLLPLLRDVGWSVCHPTVSEFPLAWGGKFDGPYWLRRINKEERRIGISVAASWLLLLLHFSFFLRTRFAHWMPQKSAAAHFGRLEGIIRTGLWSVDFFFNPQKENRACWLETIRLKSEQKSGSLRNRVAPELSTVLKSAHPRKCNPRNSSFHPHKKLRLIWRKSPRHFLLLTQGEGHRPVCRAPGGDTDSSIFFLPPLSIPEKRVQMSGQTLTDRIAAAQYQLTGSDMARAVCKATTHEVMAPKKKHLECEYEYCHPPFRQAGRPFFFLLHAGLPLMVSCKPS